MRNKMIRVILGVLTATMLLSVPVFAADPEGDGGEPFIEEEETRTEEFMWFYRTYNGMEQMRLWSLTYGYWVTDWIDIGPA